MSFGNESCRRKKNRLRANKADLNLTRVFLHNRSIYVLYISSFEVTYLKNLVTLEK